MRSDEARDFLFSHVVCGCGAPESAAQLFVALLESVEWWQPEGAKEPFTELLGFYQTPTWYLLMYMLDNLELTEHGGTIHCAWLTPKGKELLAALQEIPPEQLLEEEQ